MNKSILVGRLTKDMELRYTTAGKAVARGTVACQRDFKNADGKYDADFINIVVWGPSAEFIVKNTSKGGRVSLIGRNQINRYEGQDGVVRYNHEVVADTISPIDWNNDGSNNSGNSGAGGWSPGGGGTGQNNPSYNNDPFSSGGQIDLNDEDLPF